MNENRYKETFKAVAPSEEAVERIYELTTDKKKFGYKKAIRRAAAAAMALALVIGGGFCADYLIEKQSTDALFNSDKLSVLVAYASEKGNIKLKKAYKYQDFFYRIYVIDYKDDEETRRKAELEYNQQLQDRSVYDGKAASGGKLSSTINDINNHYKTIGAFHAFRADAEFVLNINNFTDIKDITFENTSKYGEMHLEYAEEGCGPYPELAEAIEKDYAAHPETKIIPLWYPESLDGHKFSITGEKLQWSLELDRIIDQVNGKHTESYGYSLYWDVTSELINELDHNIDFDLSQIQDTITITVAYLDGTTASTSIYVSCDKDGYVTLSSEE